VPAGHTHLRAQHVADQHDEALEEVARRIGRIELAWHFEQRVALLAGDARPARPMSDRERRAGKVLHG
jgi:hypothetical protein